MVAIIEPKLMNPKNEKELENLMEGDLVKVNVDNSYPRWFIYEGVIENKYAFLEPTKDGILSWRCEKNFLTFNNNGIIFPSHRQVELYTSKNKDYQEKSELIKNSISEVMF